MRLYTEHTQIVKGKETSFRIEVNYDKENKTWLNVVAIEAYDKDSRVTTDITHALMDNFPTETETLINSVDWYEISSQHK